MTVVSPRITWLLVTTRPEGSTMTPLPWPEELCTCTTEGAAWATTFAMLSLVLPEEALGVETAAGVSTTGGVLLPPSSKARAERPPTTPAPSTARATSAAAPVRRPEGRGASGFSGAVWAARDAASIGGSSRVRSSGAAAAAASTRSGRRAEAGGTTSSDAAPGAAGRRRGAGARGAEGRHSRDRLYRAIVKAALGDA